MMLKKIEFEEATLSERTICCFSAFSDRNPKSKQFKHKQTCNQESER